MRHLFWYKRQVKVKAKEEGEEEKEILVQVWDCLNINCIVRGHWVNENTFSVLMNDGHEQADDVEKAIMKHGKVTGKEVRRERAWFVSQIEIGAEDALRLCKIAGLADDDGAILTTPNMITPIEDFIG